MCRIHRLLSLFLLFLTTTTTAVAARSTWVPSSHGKSPRTQFTDVESSLRREVLARRTPGLQYVHVSRDSVLFRFVAGHADLGQGRPVTAATTFNGFSTTKTMTAVAVLQLAEQGRVALDAPAATYLEGFPYPADITVRHLLTHTSGIPNPIPLKWVHVVEEHDTFDRNAFFRGAYARHGELQSEPNARVRYSNLGYELLGEIIEAVTGMTYEAYVTQHVLERIGISPTELGFTFDPSRHAVGYHRRASLSYPVLGFLIDGKTVLGEKVQGWRAFRPYYMNGAAYGGLIGTADGFARYLQALLDTSGALLTPESRRLLFTEHVLADGKPAGMAASWFLGALEGEPYVDHAGGGGGYYAELRIYPGLGRGSVLLMNRTGMRNGRLLDEVDRALIVGARGGRGVVRAEG